MILGMEFDMEKFFGAFVGGHDFGLARALGGLIFSLMALQAMGPPHQHMR